MACYHKLYKSHSWLWAQQLKRSTHIAFICKFLLPHSYSWSAPVRTDWDNGSFSIISLTSCQEALSEGQFVKQTHNTYFVWSWCPHTKRWYWSQFFFFYTMKLNHSVLSGSDGVSLWRLLCSLVHPKTQHLKCLFGALTLYIIVQQVISNGWFGLQLLTQCCVYAYRTASQMRRTFSPQWCEQRENLLVLRDCLWFF